MKRGIGKGRSETREQESKRARANERKTEPQEGGDSERETRGKGEILLY